MNRFVNPGSIPQVSDVSPNAERVRQVEERLIALNLGGCVSSKEGEDFDARISAQPLDQGILLSVEATPATYRRCEVMCPASAEHRFALGILHSGNAKVEQYGRNISLIPGDCCFIDLDVPFTIINDRYRLSLLAYGEKIAGHWLPDPRMVSGTLLSQSTPWGMALSASLKALAVSPLSELPVPASAVINQINCLLALAFGQDKSHTKGYQRRIYQRLQHSIRKNYSMLSFSPRQCADLCGISLRYLHMIFSKFGSSFSQDLKRYRLEVAHYYICNSRYSIKSIAEIAYLCGFRNAGHFSTCFRKVYGMSPVEYRRTI